LQVTILTKESLSALVTESEVLLGEYKIEFSGRDRAHAKRKALDYWYQHRDALNLSMRDFFLRCRLKSDERTIVFVYDSTDRQ
jgi:hypothetical protein